MSAALACEGEGGLRRRIVAEAQAWIGTPYRHQASVRGAGCDCLGLVRGVWRACVGAEPCAVPAYSQDWSDPAEPDLLLDSLRAVMGETVWPAALPGDVLAFRIAAGAPARHLAILSRPDRIIHAYWGRAVVETRLVPWWARRLAGVFVFPGACGTGGS